ncbi:MAG: hypothetical protein C5B59_13395 [Bacteroidetes bacterium]|nr:MAG: hypothetical protein C5B59_13395 [Bacteroidota bacterium]
MKTLDQQVFSFSSFIDRLRKNRKLIKNYAAGFILVGVVFGSLTLMHTGFYVLLRLIQLIAFAAMGWIHVRAIQNANFLTRDYYQEYLFSTILLALAIFLALEFIYLVTGTDSLMALASACVFMLPFTLSQAWFFYKHIPKQESLVWNNSVTPPDPQTLLFRNIVEIRFQLALKYFDMQEMVFPVKVSSWIKLGALFNQFILDQTMDNKYQIELVDMNKNQYGWEFYAETMGGLISRQLDPELNTKENDIGPDEIIVARRVKMQQPLEQKVAS